MYTKQITIIGDHAQVTVEVQNTVLSVVAGLTIEDQCPTTFGIADVEADDIKCDTFEFLHRIGMAVQGLGHHAKTLPNNPFDEASQAMMVAEVRALLDPLFKVAEWNAGLDSWGCVDKKE